MTQEWTPTKKWNPFNSAKLLAHVDRWKQIVRGQEIPAPVLVTIDPTNECNLNCSWCNAKKVRESGGEISAATLKDIAMFLGGQWGTKAVCIAGGGEPTQHEGFGELIADLIRENIRVGVVTNGTRIDDFQQMLTFCDWVGISIDAGTTETYTKNKGKQEFDHVLDQSKALIEMARGLNRPLSKPGLGNGVFWKYLVHPSNIIEMDIASRMAKAAGFKGIHFRPVGASFDDDPDSPVIFGDASIRHFNAMLKLAYCYDDKDFSVYGVQHKFTQGLRPCHNFKKCMAVFMTCVFMPPSNGGDGFDLGLCCDRRGDRAMNLLTNADTYDIRWSWGSGMHWGRAGAIKPHEQCPRCTYAPHNEIFENVIEKDSMTHDFI